MRSKLLAGAAALVFGATASLAIAPAAGYADPAYVNGDGYTYDWGSTPNPRDSYDPGYAADPGYAPGPGSVYVPGPSSAYAPGYDYGTSPSDDDDAYCAQRFRSYDPASGTYLGYDGLRHSCP